MLPFRERDIRNLVCDLSVAFNTMNPIHVGRGVNASMDHKPFIFSSRIELDDL